MRNAFADEIVKIAEADERFVLLSGDIGNRLFDKYRERFPNRFFNCGVAEANMVSLAAGMAMNGLKPFAYTITPFVTTRTMEQIRVDVCYHNVPVTIVGVGAGLSYSNNGATHHSMEDIAMLRSIPHMSVVCPGDAWEVRGALNAAMKHNGPLYLRIGKKGEPEVHKSVPKFEIGKAIPISAGKDLSLLVTGNLLPVAVEVIEKLKASGKSVRLDHMHTVKPLDETLLAEVFATYPLVVTLEEHGRIGGFGSAVAEWLSDREPQRARLMRIGSADDFLHEAGEQEHARKCFGLDADSVTKTILSRLGS